MKYHYFTEKEFLSKCPCGYHLSEYVQTLIPPRTSTDLALAREEDENTYTAEYDVFSSMNEHLGRLTVSCTIQSDRTYSYKLLHKSGSF